MGRMLGRRGTPWRDEGGSEKGVGGFKTQDLMKNQSWGLFGDLSRSAFDGRSFPSFNYYCKHCSISFIYVKFSGSVLGPKSTLAPVSGAML